LLCSSTQVLPNGVLVRGYFIDVDYNILTPLFPMLFVFGHGCSGPHDFEGFKGRNVAAPSKKGTTTPDFLYADDLVRILSPEVVAIAITIDILHLFDIASWLKINL
jgi:hypothetical protein